MSGYNSLVSVIIPLYKVEAYLSKCIESMLNQTYPYLELLLVDDGSPDSCGLICDEYSQQDNRIKVLHQSNGGVVKARNEALKMASGKYLAFIDSDDWLDSRAIEHLVKQAEKDNADIVWFSYIEEDEQGKELARVIQPINEPMVMLHKLLSDEVKGFLWNKLIKRDFFMNCHIQTDEKCTVMEDKYMLVQLLSNNPKLASVPVCFYHYVSRSDSATGSLQASPLLRGSANVLHIYEFLQRQGTLRIFQTVFFKEVMKVKFAFLAAGRIREAQQFIPLAHRALSTYPLSTAFSLLYWIGFNTGFLGSIMLSFYQKLTRR